MWPPPRAAMTPTNAVNNNARVSRAASAQRSRLEGGTGAVASIVLVIAVSLLRSMLYRGARWASQARRRSGRWKSVQGPWCGLQGSGTSSIIAERAQRPTTHLGPAVASMERRGIETEVGKRLELESLAAG